MDKILDIIHGPQNLKNLSAEQLNQLAGQLREMITHSVSRTGGHLASNLGVVELTIALHCVFEFDKDRLLWDVGHQCYAHKILTGRKDQFEQLRQEGGLSGFPNPPESPYDVFAVGHAGSSIATALGMAIGAQQKGTDEKIVALVGDASIVNGLSFEALNNLGLVKRQMLVVLNDNSMAIDVTQGAIAKFLSGVRLSHTYEDIRKTTTRILDHLPVIGRKMEGALENFKKTLRMAISPSRLFESLNIPYFGPVDGHDIPSLIQLFKALKELDRPVILHVYTKKGKGFTPADDNPRKYHSTGPFELNGEAGVAVPGERFFTEAFGDALADLGSRDDKIIAITAAMADGTGLNKFRKAFPNRCIDVGIAESTAVDVAAGLAKQGLKPMVCIYSTFLQRSFDQIFQEVALQNLPVVFCIDRAGVVGGDGPTHHGLLDIGYMRMLPNMEILCPADEPDLRAALDYAVAANKPVVIRYPKDNVCSYEPQQHPVMPFESGKSVFVRQTSGEIVIVAVGSILNEALKAADILKQEEGIEIGVVNARFVKPADDAIIELFAQDKTVILAEDHGLACGFGSAVLEQAVQKAYASGNAAMKKAVGRAVLLAGPDEFIPAASRARQIEWMGLTAEKMVEVVKSLRHKSAVVHNTV